MTAASPLPAQAQMRRLGTIKGPPSRWPTTTAGVHAGQLEDRMAVPADTRYALAATGRGDPRTRRGRRWPDPDHPVLYGQIAAPRARPSSLHVASDGAREVTEQLITDAGYHPMPLGGLDQVRALEDLTWLLSAAMKEGAPIFDRFAVPGEL